MLNVVLIATQKQLQTAQQIITAVLANMPASCRLVVVYEAHQDDISLPTTNKLFDLVLAHHDFTGFSAGANRDLGIAYVEQHYPGNNSFVFLDGDCLPSPCLLEHHARLLNYPYAVITCGSRKNETYSKQVLEDKRLVSPLIQPRVFVPGMDRVVFDVRDIRAHNVVWSCNLGINHLALEKIRQANRHVSSSNRVFADVFDGQWGGEDTLLGLAGFHNSCMLVCLDPLTSWVLHQEHEITYQGTKNLKRVYGYSAQIQANLHGTTLVVSKQCVVDTPDFYSCITSVIDVDPFISSVCEHHKLNEHESACAQYMFGANPKIVVDPTQKPMGTITQQRLQTLYRVLRTKPLSIKDVMV